MNEPRRPEAMWAAFDFPRHPLAREDGERLRGAWYAPPDERLLAERPEQLPAVIAAAEAAARAGAWVLGGLRYEAAAALDHSLSHHRPAAPLAEFAVYRSAPESWPEEGLPAGTGALAWVDTQAEADEATQIERIREWIRAGDCYQVNLTTRLQSAAVEVDLARIFLALHASQPGGFSLFMRDEHDAGVASVSPELFFDWRPLPEGPRTWLLAAQPMKGTAARGRDRVEDEAAQQHLRTSEKERAENLMIVDLLRNDMSRVATLGSVRVPRLFELHALPTVWQMTSTVTAVTRAGVSLAEVFAALFPCGSVTGAPKRRAMQIIAELERDPRGWYCGALGLLQPGGLATFNVPIRTVERGAGAASLRCGIGSAITLDSAAEAEIAEWRAKARFLSRAEAPIEALETLRLQDGAWQRLAGHQARMQRTAQHFGLRWSNSRWRETLAVLQAAHPQGAWRVRLTLAASGEFNSQVQPLSDTALPVLLQLATMPIACRGAAAEFIQHKTTRRELYEAFAKNKPGTAFDVLLWNEDGELTECSFGNIALQIDGRWLTPRTEAGLLPGVLREELLAQGRLHEARLTIADLGAAQALAFFNSLRGWCPAELIQTPDAADAGRV
ncbi:chorismate-binding protein [Paucibacter sp. APW11]|uniref:Chorismate-binding protein n=1 Tax=Roseateles aquae TaxID=3077235 RepID=A0ABU3P6B4_9BURK|nr:chorismate-binding protein [Paucibacter sp. APW11]MDT8998110.1 chorismate-binding protein [Paucibacter sp. APW11]